MLADPETPADPIIRLENIWKSFHCTAVLTDVSMDVPRGQVVCIIGPSGAGKSTLLRCINPVPQGASTI